MRTKKKLKPGQDGTKSLLNQYGEQPVCVRYRYDEQNQLRHKTIELIIETAPWTPKPPEIAAAAVVGVKIGIKEVELQRKIKQAGGKWNLGKQVWELRYDEVITLNLKPRIEPSCLPNGRQVKVTNSRKNDLPTIRQK